MYGDDFDTLNPAFQDLGAWVESEDPTEWYEEEEEDNEFYEDDFPIDLEYDEGEDDMYADGEGFYTNEPW